MKIMSSGRPFPQATMMVVMEGRFYFTINYDPWRARNPEWKPPMTFGERIRQGLDEFLSGLGSPSPNVGRPSGASDTPKLALVSTSFDDGPRAA